MKTCVEWDWIKRTRDGPFIKMSNCDFVVLGELWYDFHKEHGLKGEYMFLFGINHQTCHISLLSQNKTSWTSDFLGHPTKGVSHVFNKRI